MANFEMLEVGHIALIQQTKEGRILQIGLTQMQSDLLQNFLGVISKDTPLVQMGKDWDLVLKSSIKKKKQSKTT